MFEPEKVRADDYSLHSRHGQGGHRVKMGPLEIALQDRHQLELFCSQPLVLDFMSRKFSCGLPGLGATEADLQDADQVERYRRDHLSVQEVSNDSFAELGDSLLGVLAGPDPTFGSLTLLPGAQFIIAQVVTRPAFCYAVPAVRMGMYLILYIAMLMLFGSNVLLYDGDVSVAEVVFFVYVVVSSVRVVIGGVFWRSITYCLFVI